MSDRRFLTIDDAVSLAKRRLPRLIFDFVDGAAERERAAHQNRRALDAIELQPRILRDVGERSPAADFLGECYAVPFGIAPMGMCNVVHPGADRMLAEAAVARNMPVCLSTAASTSIEDMAGFAAGNAWFQLYVAGAKEQAMSLVERARQSGYKTLVLTGDVPQVARRVRDVRNGFQMPFRIGFTQAIDFALHPAWSMRMLAAGVPQPANFATAKGGKGFDRHASRAGATFAFLDELREAWPDRLIVKGVMSVDDAVRVRDAGADAVWISNHGGRQLNAAPAAISVVAKIRAAVGREFPVIFDSGVRYGEDVVKALALGADFVMLGRPMLFAIGAAGAEGLRTYLDLLTEEISLVLAQIGCGSIEEIGHDALANPPSILTGMDRDDDKPALRDRRRSFRKA